MTQEEKTLDAINQRMSVLKNKIVKELKTDIHTIIENELHDMLECSNDASEAKSQCRIQDSLDKLTKAMHSLGSDLQEVKTSQQYLSDKFDSILNKLAGVEEITKINKTEITKNSGNIAELQMKVQAQNVILDDSKKQTDDLDQYIRKDNLEFHGVPFRPEENTNILVKRIAQLLRIEIKDYDISISHHLPQKRTHQMIQKGEATSSQSIKPPPIIVKFSNRAIRNAIYKNRSKLRSAPTSKDFPETPSMFIVENLTKANKELFFKTRDLKRAQHYKYLWTDNCKILIKKNDKSQTLHISCCKDLEKIR